MRFESRHRAKDGRFFPVEVSTNHFKFNERYLACAFDRDISERKQVENALKESEERFRAIFENAPYPIVITSLKDGKYVDANKAFLDTRGISREELLGYTHEDFALINDNEITDIMNELNEKGVIKNREATIVNKDGTHNHIYFSSVLLEFHGNMHVLSMTVDVTEKKHAEEALKKSEKRFRTLFKMAPIPMANISRDGKINELNYSLTQLMGYTIDDVPTLEQAWNLSLPDPDLRKQVILKWRTELEKSLADNSDMESFECPVLCKDGTEHAMIVGTKLIADSIIVSFFDITEQKKVKEAIDFERQQLLSIFNNMSEIIYVSDPVTYEMLFANQYLRKLIGKDPTGGLCYKELQNLDRPCYFCTNNIILNNDGKPYRWQYHNPVSNIDVDIVDQIIRWPDGRDVRLEIAADITEQKQAEKDREKLQNQLLQSQKLEAVGTLAGGVAHDFNNMLGAIIGYTELTVGEIDPANPLRENLDRILEAAQRSSNLTRQLLAFARKQIVEPVIFELNEPVEAILKMIRRLIGENIELARLPGINKCTIRMDPSQFDQILVNLCVNAKDAITGIGKITIETDSVAFDEEYCETHAEYVPGRYVLLSVSDNGCGMDKETQNHIFEPFFTTKSIGKGTGMGLATVYGIIKQNDGFINVYSEPDQGTTFKIYIPCHADKVSTEQPEKKEKIPHSRGETILLVEDDPTLLTMSTRMLQRLGYTVLPASTPQEAIRLVSETDPKIHLFITDVVMPEMNGRELAERILAIRPAIKHLFMSGYTADVIAHQGVLDKGINFIQKPFSLKDMASKIREVLD
ncbi:MAG: PAS domain S-box protein [Candidatus Latescibacteria bacterium]|nr:PAS domain S-box protein [Candidatus Latescibacterota bacterium]